MERSRQGADGSSLCGRQPPGALWRTNARTGSSAERTPVGRLRPVARSVAQRSPLGCSAVLPTPLRRAPRERPGALRPPGLRLGALSTPALLPTAPPARNPRPIPRQPHSGPPDSGHARSPSRRSPSDRSPAECLPVLRAKVRAAAKPPAASYGFRGKRLSPGLEPETFRSSPLDLDHSISGAVASYLFFFLQFDALCGRQDAVVRSGALAPSPGLSRDLALPSRACPWRGRTHRPVAACGRARAYGRPCLLCGRPSPRFHLARSAERALRCGRGAQWCLGAAPYRVCALYSAGCLLLPSWPEPSSRAQFNDPPTWGPTNPGAGYHWTRGLFLALLRVVNQIGRGRERGHSPLLGVAARRVK